MFRQRLTLQKVGTVLRYMGVGFIGAILLRVFYFHDKITWNHWFQFSAGVLILTVTSVILPYNKKFLIAHAVAHDGMMGMLQTEPNSSQRILYLDQAQAALEDLLQLHVKAAKRIERFKLFRKKS